MGPTKGFDLGKKSYLELKYLIPQHNRANMIV